MVDHDLSSKESGFVSVRGKDGHFGVIDSGSQPLDGSQTHILVRLENDQQVWVPFNLLEPEPDGFYLPVSRAQLQFHPGGQVNGQSGPALVLPVIQEELNVSTRRIKSGVRVTKQVSEHEETVDEPTILEEVEVERVPRNQVLENSIEPYYEGDTLIIPVVEEELVVEKRLVLKEEVRITKQRKEIHRPQQVTLRRENAVIEPIEDQEDQH